MKNINLLTLALIALIFVGCAKDREDRENQVQQDIVVPIGDFDQKVLTLRTTTVLGETPLLSDAVTTNADISSASISNSFKMMNYETESDLFEDVPFFALPGQEYQLHYEVTSTHLVINKVAAPELIPFHERTFAKVSGNKLIVPMVGYPINLYRRENFINADGERTGDIINIPVKKREDATHMSIIFEDRVTFDAAKKHNVLPVDLFIDKDPNVTKEWFYSSTIVGAPPRFANLIGRNVTADFTANPVSRIKFVKTKNSIIGVNLNIDSAIDLDDENNFEIAIQIPIEWIDYRRQMEGDNELLKEEVLDNDNLESRHFSQRKYLKADFRKSTTANSVGFNDSFANDYILSDLEITEGYLSFVTHHRISGIKTRYSFREAHQPKVDEAKQYFKTDRDIYGYFETYRNVLNNHTQEREVDQQKNVLINHYMPELDSNGHGEIRYFFSKRTPAPMKKVGRIAVRVWNEAFAKAGTNIKIVLDETKAVNLGDVRFNIINIVDTKNGGNLLGYGPTIADSETGEIISGSSNIYADPFREGLIRNVRNYIRSRRGLFASNYLPYAAPTSVQLGEHALNEILKYSEKIYEGLEVRESDLTNYVLPTELDKIKQAHEAFEKEEERLRGLKGKMNLADFLVELESSHKKFIAKHGEKYLKHGQSHYGPGHHGSFETSSKDIIEEIEGRCKTELDEYIAELEADGVYHNERELEVIYACINKSKEVSDESITVDRESISLLEARVLSTLVHEMGHNFSLRHNFIASTDTEHFTTRDGKVVAQSSSIMDYNSGNVYELLAPGEYDIEAIRFLYASQVKKKDGTLVNVDKKKPVAEQPALAGRLELKFCTDEDAMFFPGVQWTVQVDPMCARHDHGTTPLEVVEENIKAVNSLKAVFGHRYDRAAGRSSFGMALSILQRNLLPLKKIYVQWRYHLGTFVGEENRYLENFSARDLAFVLERMKNDTGVHGKNYALYHDAAKKAYEFLRDLAFTTGKYCVITKNGTDRELIDFETLQNNVYKSSAITIKSCTNENEPTTKYAKQWVVDNMQAEIIDEIGEYVNDVKTTLNPADPDLNKTDISGFELTRRLAFAVLTMRSADMRHTQTEGFFPNFLDNINHLSEVGNMILGRSLNGFDQNNTNFDLGQEYQYLMFQRENVHLAEMMMMFRIGLIIPGNPDASAQRAGITQVIVTRNPNEIPDGFIRTNVAQYTVAAHPQAVFGANLIRKREQLQSQQNLARTELPVILNPQQTAQTMGQLGITPLLLKGEDLIKEDYKFASLLETSLKINTIFDAVQEPVVKATLEQVLLPYIIIAQNQGIFTPEDREQSAAQVLNSTYAQALANVGFAERIQQAGTPLNMFSLEFTFAYSSYLNQVLAQQRALRDDYIANRKDRDAQLNMVTDMLLRLGGQSGVL